ncbi:hypothetical protein POM88_034041 [Heracleum sosnowskyi]|uniref:O-fucosyltransferase family protein n=1 Tax=Heracleum sosnowskyi TaxID=360622 RepID=A0AAD8HKH6_9APIA|nr:hypothetical protein POM88_034041 [Heracleum sosnowskyi]
MLRRKYINQQRTGISDAALVSWILNATLVVPELDHNSFGKDDSDFVDTFDEDWFLSSFLKDVTTVKPPYTTRVLKKSEHNCDLDEVLPILLRRHVGQWTKSEF